MSVSAGSRAAGPEPTQAPLQEQLPVEARYCCRHSPEVQISYRQLQPGVQGLTKQAALPVGRWLLLGSDCVAVPAEKVATQQPVRARCCSLAACCCLPCQVQLLLCVLAPCLLEA